MIRPVRLRVQAFRGWLDPVEIELDRPITAVVGANRCGKSSLLNAVEWCLFGGAVEKQSTGLEERAGWEVAHRSAGGRETAVTLHLEDEDGVMALTRARAANAKKSQPDDVVLLLADGSRHTGDDAIGELVAAGMPDWETWRRAHGFHQEAARTRVTNAKDRPAVLASLLGLDEDLGIRDVIDRASRAKLIEDVDAIRADTERSVLERLANPKQRIVELEAHLLERGIQRSTLGPDLTAEVRGRLVSNASKLAERLELESSAPDAVDADAVRTWTEVWSRRGRGASPALAERDALRQTWQQLNDGVDGAESAQDRCHRLKQQQTKSVKEGGDLEARRARHVEAGKRVEAADALLTRTNRAAALLASARELVPDQADPTPCPVCATEVAGLAARIDEAYALVGSEAVESARKALDEARADEKRTRDALRAFEDEERELAGARKAWGSIRKTLAGLLDADPSDGAPDLVSAGRARLEELVTKGRALTALDGERSEAMNAHDQDAALLRLLEEWERAEGRAERVVEVEALPSWGALTEGVDAAAALACDLEALSTMAREVQAARSAERTEAVNAALGRYYGLITGMAEADGICVVVKQTARRIGYDLRDGSGELAVPVLNQAALNALSLAMLFAQAEERARRGGLPWVVIDDPIQSLDEAHQEGLARAIETLSETCPVLVASVPSPFVARLESYVATPRRFVRLGAWDATRGASVEEDQTR